MKGQKEKVTSTNPHNSEHRPGMRACAKGTLLRRSRAGRARASGAGIRLLGERDDVRASALFFANGCRQSVVTHYVRRADDARKAQI